ncbi:MAG: hypothetical protein ACRC6M_13380 [Microcystaceae cyanobacterium]
MILKNIALLTGLSLAGAIGSSAFLSAQAITFNGFAEWDAAGDVVVGDKTFNLGNYSNNDLGWVGSIININEVADNIFSVNIGPTPTITTPGTYFFEYSVVVNNPLNAINQVDLNTNTRNTVTTKNLWSDAYDGTVIDTLVSNNNLVTSTFAPQSQLFIRDTAVLGGGSGFNQISSVTNTIYQVPWETDVLPVIGAVAFFGAGMFAKKKLAKAKSGKVNLDA